MAVGSGISGSFGWSKETVFGTRVAPAKFIRHNQADFQREQNRINGTGIQAGALGLRGDHYVETHQWASAQVDFYVTTLNMLQLWENLMGSGSISLLSGSAYGATFSLADNYGKSLTMQSNVPLRAVGTTKAKEITGAKMTQATFACGIGTMLTCSAQFQGRKYDTSQSLAAPSYVAGVPFHFGMTPNLKLGTFGSEAAVAGIRNVSVSVNRVIESDSFTFNNSGLMVEPLMNAPQTITATVEADYNATADFEDRFTGLTLPSMVFEVVSPVAISGSNYPTFRVTVPGVSIDGPSQNVTGYDVPRNTWNLTWQYDGTNLPSIYVITSETSI